MKLKTERWGEVALAFSIAIFGLFPIITSYAGKQMPPLLFAGTTLMITAASCCAWLVVTGKIKSLLNKNSWRHIFKITLLNIIIPFIFIFYGASKTSEINTSLLLQTELVWTFLISILIWKEAVTMRKMLGAMIILIGATAVILKDTIHLNYGDFLIVAGTLFYPFGNFYAKKYIKEGSITMLLLLRSILGGAVLLILSLLFETYTAPASQLITQNIMLLMVNALVIFHFAKIFWFEGLRRLEISKAITMSTAGPALSLVYAAIFSSSISHRATTHWIGDYHWGMIILTAPSKTVVVE